MSAITARQLKTLAIVPKVSTSLSIFGSSWIIMEIVKDKKKMGLVYHRLLLVMSVGDIVLSFGYFLSTWPVPEGTPGAFFARGNTATCTAQGFIIQVGGITTLYGAFLAIYYVLVIRYKWSEGRLEKIERAVFAFTVLLAISTGVASLVLKLFNSATLWCWIAPFPTGCKESRESSGATTCKRGDNASIYRFAFMYAWLWTGLLIVTVCMFLVYSTVDKQARRMTRYSSGGRLGQRNRRLVAGQAKLYIFSFFSIGTFNSLTRLVQMINGKVYFPVLLLMVIFTPLQGFWNLMIYLRPRYLSYKEKHPEWSVPRVVAKALRRAFLSVSKKKKKRGNTKDNEDADGLDEDDDDYRLGTLVEAEDVLPRSRASDGTGETASTTLRPADDDARTMASSAASTILRFTGSGDVSLPTSSNTSTIVKMTSGDTSPKVSSSVSNASNLGEPSLSAKSKSLRSKKWDVIALGSPTSLSASVSQGDGEGAPALSALRTTLETAWGDVDPPTSSTAPTAVPKTVKFNDVEHVSSSHRTACTGQRGSAGDPALSASHMTEETRCSDANSLAYSLPSATSPASAAASSAASAALNTTKCDVIASTSPTFTTAFVSRGHEATSPASSASPTTVENIYSNGSAPPSSTPFTAFESTRDGASCLTPGRSEFAHSMSTTNGETNATHSWSTPTNSKRTSDDLVEGASSMACATSTAMEEDDDEVPMSSAGPAGHVSILNAMVDDNSTKADLATATTFAAATKEEDATSPTLPPTLTSTATSHAAKDNHTIVPPVSLHTHDARRARAA